MKRLTKLSIIAALRMSALAFSLFGTLLYSKLSGPAFDTKIGAAICGSFTFFCIVQMFKGFFSISKAVELERIAKEDPELVKQWELEDANKKRLKHVVKKLRSCGMAKEIYKCDDFLILNVNDMFYLVCPYFYKKLMGLAFSGEILRRFIGDSGVFFRGISWVDKDILSEQIVGLEDEQLNDLIEECRGYIAERPTELIDKTLEKELILHKIATWACAVLPYLAMVLAFLPIPCLLLSILSLAGGIISLVYTNKIPIKLNSNTVWCILLSMFVFFLSVMELLAPPKEDSGNYTYARGDYAYANGLDFTVPPIEIDIDSLTGSYTLPTIDFEEMPLSIGRRYSADVPYAKGSITNNVYYSEFIELKGVLPEGYSWMSDEAFDGILENSKYSIDWECGVKGLQSPHLMKGAFSFEVENDICFADCIEIFKAMSPGFSEHGENSTGTIIGFVTPEHEEIDNARMYYLISLINDNGVKRRFVFNVVDDRLVCIFEQSKETDQEKLNIFYAVE